MLDMETEKPITRIQLFARVSHLSIKKFEVTCKLNPNLLQNALNRKSSLSDETLGKIKLAFPNLNLDWVILGHGKMLLNDPQVTHSELQQEPDYKYFLEIIQQIGNQDLAAMMQDKLFALYQTNSSLKTDLLNAYKLINTL